MARRAGMHKCRGAKDGEERPSGTRAFIWSEHLLVLAPIYGGVSYDVVAAIWQGALWANYRQVLWITLQVIISYC